MQKVAKITSKGQITVPNEVRRALGVQPGDSLLFEDCEGDIRVVPMRRESRFARYRGIGNPQIGSGKTAIMTWVRELRGE
ncbi:MAG: AbrB/MazE/SpoVT family DNA-binding domain-containing protein [Acidobacteriaceae bacterium]